jgi:hypothetical protein
MYECRCDGRLQTKRFTNLSHTGLVVELEHLRLRLIRKVAVLGRVRPTFPLSYCEKAARRKWNWSRSVCGS